MIKVYNLEQGSGKGIVLTPLGFASKEKAHQKGLLHKSAHLLMICDGRILCRHRKKTEERYSDMYTTTIGTHVLNDDDYLDTLRPFLPDKSLELIYVGEFFVHDEFENEINGLYVIDIGRNNLLDDFLEGRDFLSESELRDLITRNKTTPHLAEAFKLVARGK